MYRFLRTPRWVAFTAAVLALMVLMLLAARWQWNRYDARRERNAQVSARAREAPVPVTAVLTPSDPLSKAKQAEWQVVTATGTYQADQQVVIRDRSYQGSGGFHVVTPLRLNDGTLLLVNRGWIDITRTTPPAPPAGEISLSGRIRATQTRGSIGPRDPAEGRLSALARVDVGRIAQQLPGPVVPAYVELIEQRPAVVDGDPLLIPEPPGDNGPHLSYMVQWIVFTLCAAAGWIIVVRRTAHKPSGRATAMPAATTSP